MAATPSQLEVLRKAGVVDSGGEGYRVILEGAWMWSTGRSLEPGADAHTYSRALLQAVEEESTFGFCTEFLLRDADLALPEVKQRMEALGESVIAVGDRDLMRVHVHTLRPGQALEFAVDHGTLAKVKVENMQLQHEAFAAAAEQAAREARDAIAQVQESLREAQAKVVERDPLVSARWFARAAAEALSTTPPNRRNAAVHQKNTIEALNSSGYRELIVLPNNSNVILTARQVQELTPHTVTVISTETAPQGIGALLAFNFEADMQTNVAAMQQAAHAVHTLEVTRAVRDAEVDGLSVKPGELMGIYDGRVVVTSTSADEALLGALSHAPIDGLEIVTIYHGAGASEDQAQAVAARIREAHPGLDVEVFEGGQPHYPYVASLE